MSLETRRLVKDFLLTSRISPPTLMFFQKISDSLAPVLLGNAYKCVAYKKACMCSSFRFRISRIKNSRNVSTKKRPNKGNIALWM